MLACSREARNHHDQYAVAVEENSTVIGHLPKRCHVFVLSVMLKVSSKLNPLIGRTYLRRAIVSSRMCRGLLLYTLGMWWISFSLISWYANFHVFNFHGWMESTKSTKISTYTVIMLLYAVTKRHVWGSCKCFFFNFISSSKSFENEKHRTIIHRATLNSITGVLVVCMSQFYPNVQRFDHSSLLFWLGQKTTYRNYLWHNYTLCIGCLWAPETMLL